MTEEEKYYDEVIAPKLAELANDCTEHGLSFFAAVQYSENDIAETRKFAHGYLGIMQVFSNMLRAWATR